MVRRLTEILGDMNDGHDVRDELFECVYTELNEMARAQMLSERKDHTLQATALVHEAFLRLAPSENSSWENRRHFFGAAAESMRRILVDSARSKARLKRGGDAVKRELSDSLGPSILQSSSLSMDHVLDLNEHLDQLESESKELADLVKLKFFVGLSMDEIANALDMSLSTVERRWRFARAWLAERMDPHE
ncbi:MAG: ECF-type sigma factor [Planctomycetota bacterium]